MNRLADYLTNYIIKKGVAQKDYDVYQYGFLSALEIIFSFIISLIIAIRMNMIFESCIFFLIFIPLRTYAGGLHLEKYLSCLLLSCLTLVVVLIIVKNISIPMHVTLISSIAIILLIKFLYPVEHVNRPVDKEENNFFERKINKIMITDTLISVMVFLLKWNKIALLLTITLAVVGITMVLGKIKYNFMMMNN